jgi:formylglycine-generating enzyme required for sulfatase activity
MTEQSTSTRVKLAILSGLLGLPAYCSAAEGATYVPIPAGAFVSVLSNADKAPVKIAPFSMRATLVTNREFRDFAAKHSEWQRGKIPAVFADGSYLHSWQSALEPGKALGADLPVTSVSWFAAQAYCESEGARLPTWYEWEYVAAADETRADARGDPDWRARILAWYAQSPNRLPIAADTPPNFYAVRDMHNVAWEWVDDFNALLVSADSRNQGDPDKLQFCGAGAISLQDRENYAVLMRIALLSSLNGADTTNNLGFRCARGLTGDVK